MVLTVTEDTPADMLAGSMELLVQLPLDHHVHTQRVTVLRNTPMMDLLVQIATAHKLTASSYTLQAIGERGLVLPHHPNTPIGALDALQVKLLPKQGTCVPRKTKQTNQPFETTFRLQVHLPRNQLYVSRVSPKMNLGEILDEVCREKNLDRNKYELRHPANLEETLDLALSLQDYHLQEVTLYAKQARTLGPTLSTQDIMALQRQEERRRQQTKQSVFGFMFKKSKESSLSTDSLGGRSVSPARSDETGRSASPLQPPARPQRKRRPAPKPPTDAVAIDQDTSEQDSGKDKMVINHSRNSSDSSGYHEASVLSDNPDSAARLPETLPRRSKVPGISDAPRKLAQTSQSSKSLGNLAAVAATAALSDGGTLTRGISSSSLSSTGLRKKRAAPPPPAPRPLSSAISTQALERIVDSEESLTSDIDPSKPPSDIGAPSKASSDIDCPKANSDIGVSTQSMRDYKAKAEAVAVATCESGESNIPQHSEARSVKSDLIDCKLRAKADPEVAVAPVEAAPRLEQSRVTAKRGKLARSASNSHASLHDPKTRGRSPNPHEVGEGTKTALSRASTFSSEKHRFSASERSKLRAASRKYRRQRDDSVTVISCANDVSLGIAVKDHIRDVRSQLPKVCPKSQTLEQLMSCQVIPDSRDSRGASVSFGNCELIANRSTRSVYNRCAKGNDLASGRPSRMQTSADSNVESTPERERFLKNGYSPGFSHNDACRGKHSLSFRNSATISGATQLARSVEKSTLTSSRSLRSRHSWTPASLESAVRSSKLGRLSATKYRANSVISASESREPCNFAKRYAESNLSPPPLSTLQIFAISTGPLDIQVAPTDSIPSDIDELPSLPIINHSEPKSEERKLSILEPPPPGLVSRQESNDSWNRFLVQLNSILESRADEFV